MLQNAMPAIGLLLAMLLVAWMLQRWRRHLPGVARQTGPSLKVMNSLSLGPQQRLITVQVGEGDDQLCLVLGVTPGGITALHQFVAAPPEALAPSVQGSGFKKRLDQVIGSSKEEGAYAQP